MARGKKKLFSESKINEEERIISDIKLSFKEKGIIPYLTSKVGMGKTSLIKKINPNYLIYNISTFNEKDLIGEGDKTPDWYNGLLTLSSKSDRCLLIFDDFDKTKNNLQKYIFDLTKKERKINNLIIPSNTDILFCGVSEEYMDEEYLIDFKLNKHLKRVEKKVNVNEWIHWANNNGVNNIVKSYINENPNELVKDIKDKNGKYNHRLSLTPRNWATRISIELDLNSKKPNLSNYMDKKTEEKFLEYLTKYNELKVNDIISGKIKDIDRFTYVSSDIAFITNALIVSAYKPDEIINAIVFLNKVGYSEYKDLFLSLWSSINDNNDDLLKMKNALIKVIRRGDKNE